MAIGIAVSQSIKLGVGEPLLAEAGRSPGQNA